jgi:hypothetical protein
VRHEQENVLFIISIQETVDPADVHRLTRICFSNYLAKIIKIIKGEPTTTTACLPAYFLFIILSSIAELSSVCAIFRPTSLTPWTIEQQSLEF